MGANVFYNNRINKQAYDSLSDKYKSEIEQLKSEHTKESQNEINLLIRDAKNEVEKIYEARINELESKINTNKSNVNQKIKYLERDLSRDDKFIRLQLEKVQGDIWLLNGVEENALRRYILVFELSLELEISVDYALEDIIEILKKLETLSVSGRTQLNVVINKAPEDNYLQAKEIRKHLERITND